MGAAMVAPIVGAALTGTSTFMAAERNRTQQLAQASALSAQAEMTRQQATLAQQQSEINQRKYDKRKSELRRVFEQVQGHNRASLGAGNVDISSGSAMDVSQGNINRFALDLGENQYQKYLDKWQADQNIKTINYQAATYDAQSDYLKNTAGTWLSSFLMANMAAAGSFFSSFGGKADVNTQAGAQAPSTPTQGALTRSTPYISTYYGGRMFDPALGGQLVNSYPIH